MSLPLALKTCGLLRIKIRVCKYRWKGGVKKKWRENKKKEKKAKQNKIIKWYNKERKT